MDLNASGSGAGAGGDGNRDGHRHRSVGGSFRGCTAGCSFRGLTRRDRYRSGCSPTPSGRGWYGLRRGGSNRDWTCRSGSRGCGGGGSRCRDRYPRSDRLSFRNGDRSPSSGCSGDCSRLRDGDGDRPSGRS